jgi:hypothetical protein
MPINPSIALQATVPERPDLIGKLGDLMKLQSAQRQSQIQNNELESQKIQLEAQKLALEDAKRKREQTQRAQEIYFDRNTYSADDKVGDWDEYLAALQGKVDPDTLASITDQVNKSKEAVLRRNVAEIQLDHEKTSWLADAMAQVTDQPSYDYQLTQAYDHGLLSPDQYKELKDQSYDPTRVERMSIANLGSQKMLEYALTKEQLDEYRKNASLRQRALEADVKAKEMATGIGIETDAEDLKKRIDEIAPDNTGNAAMDQLNRASKIQIDTLIQNGDLNGARDVINKAVTTSVAIAKQIEDDTDAPVYDAPPDPATGNKIDKVTGVTPNTLYQAGIRWALTGAMPSMGRTSKGQTLKARQGVLATGSALASKAGVDVGTLQAEYKAYSGALGQLVKMQTTASASVYAAKHNMELAKAQSKKVPRGTSPLVNRYYQWAVGENLKGDPALKELEIYIYTAAREYAKVASGAHGSVAGLTDTAAKEAEKLLRAAFNPAQLDAAIAAMQGDMLNVVTGWEQEVASSSQTIADFLTVARGGDPFEEAAAATPEQATPSQPTVPGLAPEEEDELNSIIGPPTTP